MSIYNFSDYRFFLRDYIKSSPKAGRGQVGKIAEHLGVNSTLVSQVLGDRKDFSLEQGQLLTEYLGLNSPEADYFLLLLQKEKAGSKKLKDYFQKKITQAREASQEIKNRVSVDRKLSDQERAVFYSTWMYSGIRLFCSLGDGKSIEEICERFLLDRARAFQMMQFLIELGLCSQEENLYKLKAQKTHLEQGSPFLLKHYSNWRLKAIEKSERLDKKELMFTAPFSISAKNFDYLKEEFLAVIQKLYQKVEEETNPEDIACINVDLFWVK